MNIGELEYIMLVLHIIRTINKQLIGAKEDWQLTTTGDDIVYGFWWVDVREYVRVWSGQYYISSLGIWAIVHGRPVSPSAMNMTYSQWQYRIKLITYCSSIWIFASHHSRHHYHCACTWWINNTRSWHYSFSLRAEELVFTSHTRYHHLYLWCRSALCTVSAWLIFCIGAPMANHKSKGLGSMAISMKKKTFSDGQINMQSRRHAEKPILIQ